MELNVVNAGRMDYTTALAMQYELLEKRAQGVIADTLIFLEHSPVITMGRRGSSTDVLAAADILAKEGISVVETDRGGETTYHGPGQLVGYLIFDLRNHGGDIRLFVRNLEEVFIRLLAKEYGITAGRDPHHTGVWVGPEKITAIGIAIKRHITMHGFAFNVTTNLNHFSLIIPCGIRDKGVTSLQKLLATSGTAVPDMEKVRRQAEYHMRTVYGYA